MIWRSTYVRRVIPGKIQTLASVGNQRNYNLLDFPLPARLAILSEFRTQQSVGFEPHIGVPITVEARLVAAFLAFRGEKITGAKGEVKHFGIVISGIRRVSLAVEDS